MNTQRNWTRVTVFAVLALASLSSTVVVGAMSAPHRDTLDVYAAPAALDVCGETNVNQLDQYTAAIEWAEQGGPVPSALTVSCVDDSLERAAWNAGYGGESWDRFEQYMAAIEGTAAAAPAPVGAPVDIATGSQARFEQYTAAIEWAEQGGPVPAALLVSISPESGTPTASHAGYGGESWARFEQYMAAIEATVR